LGERDGIQRLQLTLQPGTFLGRQRGPRQPTLGRRLRLVLALDHATAAAFLLDQIHHRVKKVLEQPPFPPVERVDEVHQLRLVAAGFLLRAAPAPGPFSANT